MFEVCFFTTNICLVTCCGMFPQGGFSQVYNTSILMMKAKKPKFYIFIGCMYVLVS